MKRILVIEDDLNVRENIQEILDLENFHTITADNGALGVQLAKEHRPDLVLCDVTMPHLDGYGVLAQLRQDSTTANIPLIFLTARVERTDMRQGMELGANDYITKPFTPGELLKAIAIRFEQQAQTTAQAQQKLDDLRQNIAHALPHEMRTPLNGILGTVDLLISSYSTLEDAERLEMLEIIQRSGKRLHRLIQHFLLYAELEVIAANPERVQALRDNQQDTWSDCVIEETALQIAQHTHREADLELTLSDGVLPISESHLRKIIFEIVDNAFKFSDPGTPVQIVSAVEDKTMHIDVIDGGRGMTLEQIAALGACMQFERKIYEQQGSGLGWAIAQRLAELNGGALTIESVPHRQTIAHLVLPLHHGKHP